MKAHYTERPDELKREPDGSTLFRWGIEKVVTDEGTSYECNEVRIYTTPTSANLTKAVIETLWPPDIEFKLLNDHHSATLGLAGFSTAPYEDFLNARAALRDEVDRVLAGGGE